MVQTHVHVLLEIHPAISISRIVKRLKGASSAVARTEGHGSNARRLYWARGYAARSVGCRQLETVRRYLEGQPTHHPDEVILGWAGDCVDSFDRIGHQPPLRPPDTGSED